jgi:hypothetical protein
VGECCDERTPDAHVATDPAIGTADDEDRKAGWQVTGVRGATRLGSDRVQARLVTASHHTVWVQVARLPGTPG